MYLTEINSKTGLLEITDINDGLLSIKEFRVILDDDKLGLHCLTSIALTVDYLSPIRFYSDNDRPKKAMEEVTGNREAFVWNQEVVQLALKKYEQLQYDPTLEEGQIHYQRKVNKLKEFKLAEEFFGKKDADGVLLKKDLKPPSAISAELRKINDDIKNFEDNIQGKEIYNNSPVKNGYALSRLEQKLEKKNSFYNSTN